VEPAKTLAEFFGVDHLDLGPNINDKIVSSTAHIIVDVQREFCDQKYFRRGSDVTEAISNHIALNLVPQFRKAGLKTVFIYTVDFDDDYKKPNECCGGFYKVKPRPGDQLSYKTGLSAFRGTGLAARLKKSGIKNVIISGFNANACVKSTVISALKEEFNVCVLRDGIANDRWNKGDINDHINDMKKQGAAFYPSDKVLKYLTR